jgi:hypothetical protein
MLSVTLCHMADFLITGLFCPNHVKHIPTHLYYDSCNPYIKCFVVVTVCIKNLFLPCEECLKAEVLSL